MSVELVGSAVALLSPVYLLLFSMNSKMGTVKTKTERNERDIQRLRKSDCPVLENERTKVNA